LVHTLGLHDRTAARWPARRRCLRSEATVRAFSEPAKSSAPSHWQTSSCRIGLTGSLPDDRIAATSAGGKMATILNVPGNDFNWQLEYDTSIKLPDATRDLFFGKQMWEEMMTGYVLVSDPRQLFEKSSPDTQASRRWPEFSQ
jgi:hypothetical protein